MSHTTVRDWVEVGAWDGKTVFQTTLRVPSGRRAAALVKKAGAGSTLGTSKTR